MQFFEESADPDSESRGGVVYWNVSSPAMLPGEGPIENVN